MSDRTFKEMSMKGRKPEYTQGFREEAVKLWRKWDGTQEELAKHLGVTTRSLRRWLRRTEAEEAVVEARKAGVVPLRDLEVKRMGKKITQLEEANAALQETVRFLAARRRK
jgi:transposase-like protein